MRASDVDSEPERVSRRSPQLLHGTGWAGRRTVQSPDGNHGSGSLQYQNLVEIKLAMNELASNVISKR